MNNELGTQTKEEEPVEKGGMYQELSRALKEEGAIFPEAEALCQCMCEVSRQIRHCGFKCRDTGMECFACL